MEFVKQTFEGKNEIDKHDDMVNEVRQAFSKGYVQTFISKQYSSFIKDYRQIVERFTFSYADVWQLKERYRQKVYQCIEDKKATRPDYRDKQTWRRMVKEIWSKNPDITITAMCKNQDIRNSCEYSKHTNKTIRNWIKDLCPDRSKGRRPKKTKK
jgi:hypothetical protein